MVVLGSVEDTSTAEGIAKSVEEAATGTSIFKRLLTAVAEQLGLHGTHLGVSLHIFEHGFEPMFGDSHVVVEQQAVGRVDVADGEVIALGKAVILVEGNNAHCRELLA